MPSPPRRPSASSASAIRPPRSAATEGRYRVRISNPSGRTSARSDAVALGDQRRGRAEVDPDRPGCRMLATAVSPTFRFTRALLMRTASPGACHRYPGRMTMTGSPVVGHVADRVVPGLVVRRGLAGPPDRLQARSPVSARVCSSSTSAVARLAVSSSTSAASSATVDIASMRACRSRAARRRSARSYWSCAVGSGRLGADRPGAAGGGRGGGRRPPALVELGQLLLQGRDAALAPRRSWTGVGQLDRIGAPRPPARPG